MTPGIINLTKHRDERGILVAIEEMLDIPFEIKRVFYIYDVPSEKTRANHKTENSNEVLIAVSGSCSVKIIEGEAEHIYQLKDKSEALIVPAGYWRSIYDFEEDTVLLVLADTIYYLDDEK